MKERLLHILDQSTCLTRRQMKDYLAGTMLPEEIHAAETHIASCPLCSMAMEGFEAHSEEALEAIGSLNSGFLKDHFDSISPQIHLNSMTPAVPVAQHHHHHAKKKGQSINIWKISAVAAAVLIGFGVIKLYDFRKSNSSSSSILAKNEEVMPGSQSAIPEENTDRAPLKESQKVIVKNSDATSLKKDASVGEESVSGKMSADDVSSNAAGNGVMEAETKPQSAPVVARAAEPQPAAAAPKQLMSSSEQFRSDTAIPDRAEKKSLKSPDKDKIKASEDNSSSASYGFAAPAHGFTASQREKEDLSDVDHLESGDNLYGKGNYKAALNHYKSEINAPGTSKRRKAEAIVSAARCYLGMNNKAKAISLLKAVVKEGGPQHKTAKRMLRELGVDE